MKDIWSGLCVAFSLYSAIPMPQVNWEKRTMRWALSFLPLIGLIIGGVELLWFWFCKRFGAASLLYSIGAVLIPVAVSGGIHLDGLTDTCDALCSHADRDKKLEILKDPHVGAFGVMWQTGFLLLEGALFAQLYETAAMLPLALLGFALARALGGRKIVTLPCAKDSGLAYLFAEGSDKKTVAITMLMEAIVLAAGIAFLLLRQLWTVLIALCLIGIWHQLHARLCRRVFGGITGDLAGFFISTVELLALAAAAFGGLVK